MLILQAEPSSHTLSLGFDQPLYWHLQASFHMRHGKVLCHGQANFDLHRDGDKPMTSDGHGCGGRRHANANARACSCCHQDHDGYIGMNISSLKCRLVPGLREGELRSAGGGAQAAPIVLLESGHERDCDHEYGYLRRVTGPPSTW